MKLKRLHIGAAVIAVVLLCLIVLLCPGWARARSLTILVGSLALLVLLFEFVLWHQPWFHGWFIKVPDLRGTWRVEFQSSCLDPETNERVPMIVCYMGVKQTLSKIQMHLMASDFESQLMFHRVLKSSNGSGYRLIGVYSNDSNLHMPDRTYFETHQSAIIIQTHGPSQRPATLSGKFWTDHRTTDTMKFSACVNELFTRFEDADRVF